MPVIDPKGLFRGKRILRCSVMARIYYPWMLCASNTCGRIEINYEWLVNRAFESWPKDDIPTRQELHGYIKEYARNHLLFVYRASGIVWGQWDAKKCTFGKYQTTEDRDTPGPPQDAYSKWVAEYRNNSHEESIPVDPNDLCLDSNQIPIFFQSGSNHIPIPFHGSRCLVSGTRSMVIGENKSAEQSSTLFDVGLPLNTGETHFFLLSEIAEWKSLYPAVDVEQSIRSMRGWLLASPQRRKTRGGIHRFVVSWLERNQNHGGNFAIEGAVHAKSKPKARTEELGQNAISAIGTSAKLRKSIVPKSSSGNSGTVM